RRLTKRSSWLRPVFRSIATQDPILKLLRASASDARFESALWLLLTTRYGPLRWFWCEFSAGRRDGWGERPDRLVGGARCQDFVGSSCRKPVPSGKPLRPGGTLGHLQGGRWIRSGCCRRALGSWSSRYSCAT